MMLRDLGLILFVLALGGVGGLLTLYAMLTT